MAYKTFKLPEDLLMGSATAATHIEGGEQPHNWYRWSELGKIQDGSHSKVACDHINHIESDVKLLKAIQTETYRMGIEWSRIEPVEGQFSQEGIELYRKEIKLLLKNNIRPLVTLWHFSNPLWMEDDGGWINPKCVDRYLNYVRFVVDELGDLVTDWVTINEPNVYLFFGYFEGRWPPGMRGKVRKYLRGANHFAKAHLKAYDQIHEQLKAKGHKSEEIHVGVAHHLRIFDMFDKRHLTKMAAYVSNHLFQWMYLEAMTHARFVFPLKWHREFPKKNYCDFIGINYYSRDLVKGIYNPGTLFNELYVKKGKAVNDLGWEIYPKGLFRICKRVYKHYKIPIFITENGICDANDEQRAKFIYDHLKQLNKAIKKGIDIRRYYHWSTMDNFEWAEGVSARFGLYHNNYETQERTLRDSGKFYGEICKKKKVSRKMIKKYLLKREEVEA
ncbi:glycoside hydrolase family 1 protein [Marinoscillum pacificum]|uniref:glycoside hydrolase family 1 protein n=1 Tax=Marinoscillum pacificum TaxID=392723 RepID=UPI0021578A50|nr:glycoside hydrolase family 1 protein [Marinoscillum pacificum]